jgi:hypothetical protein
MLQPCSSLKVANVQTHTSLLLSQRRLSARQLTCFASCTTQHLLSTESAWHTVMPKLIVTGNELLVCVTLGSRDVSHRCSRVGRCHSTPAASASAADGSRRTAGCGRCTVAAACGSAACCCMKRLISVLGGAATAYHVRHHRHDDDRHPHGATSTSCTMPDSFMPACISSDTLIRYINMQK